MDLREEINNHIRWIDSLASLMDSDELTEERVDAISEHDQCALGKWLLSDESKAIKDLDGFNDLVECHKVFHQLAGSLVVAVQLGQEVEVASLQPRFLAESQKVIGHLQRLAALLDDKAAL